MSTRPNPPGHEGAGGGDAAGETPTRRERAAATRSRAAMTLVRFIALVGIVGLAIIVGAILTSQEVEGWIEGLVIGAGAMVLTSIVLLSRRLDRRP
jgi:hypothetical protein